MLQLLKKKKHVERIAVLVTPCCNTGCQCWWNVILIFFFLLLFLIRQDDIIDLGGWGVGRHQAIYRPRGVGESPNEKHTLRLHD